MARYYLLILKVINALIFLWILVIFLSIFDFNKVITTTEGELVLSSFLTSLRNIATYVIFIVVYGVAFVCVMVASFPFSAFQPSLFTLLDQFFRGLLSLWFTFPNGNTPEFSEIPDLIGQEFAVFSENFYLIAFQILIIIAIYYAIKAFLRTDPKNELRVVGSIVLMLVVPLMVFGFKDMLELFNMALPYLEDLPDPLNRDLLEGIPIDNIFQFFASPVIL